MNDIYDIQSIVWGWIYSYGYISALCIGFFLICFYLLVEHFFRTENILKRKINVISDTSVKERFLYLLSQVDVLERPIFYREVGVFLKFLISRDIRDDRIYFLTLEEIKKQFSHKYFPLLEEVYYYEFDKNQPDSKEQRLKILKKIEI